MRQTRSFRVEEMRVMDETSAPSTSGNPDPTERGSAEVPPSSVDVTMDESRTEDWSSQSENVAVETGTDQPQSIGRYKVIAFLGKGGFGRVYLGFDKELDRRVAIKVPNRERISSPADLEAYFKEARTLA